MPASVHIETAPACFGGLGAYQRWLELNRFTRKDASESRALSAGWSRTTPCPCYDCSASYQAKQIGVGACENPKFTAFPRKQA
jgi:hypothetical protein